MPNILKTIHRLEDYLRTYDQYQPQNLPYEVVEDAIELLNEKAYDSSSTQAEVISLDCLEYFDIAWMETSDGRAPICVLVCDVYEDGTIGFKSSDAELEWFMNKDGLFGYNRTWRCWNIYPSYERRKAVKWDA